MSDADTDGVQCEHDECDETFDTQQGMRIHHVRVHGERVVDTAICDHCGDEFEPGDGSTGKYCSIECSAHSRSKQVTLTCEHCGDEFELPPSEAEGRQYCSIDCYGEASNETELRTCPCGIKFRVAPDSDQEACSRPCEAEIRTSRPRPDDVEMLLWLLYVYEDNTIVETQKRLNHHLSEEGRLSQVEVKERLFEMGVHKNQVHLAAQKAADATEREAPTGDDSYKKYQRGEADV